MKLFGPSSYSQLHLLSGSSGLKFWQPLALNLQGFRNIFPPHLLLGNSKVHQGCLLQSHKSISLFRHFKESCVLRERREQAIMASSPKDKEEKKSKGAARYTTRGNLLDEHQKEVDEARKHFLEMDIEEKRKMYKCKGKYTTLSDVDTWPEYFQTHLKDEEKMKHWYKLNRKKIQHEVREDLNKKMSLFKGDITTLEIDSIANAANESLLGGGGVDGAIHSSSGPKLRSECELLNGCDPGNAKITCGYKLPAKHVIHTVGPRGERPDVLKNCYSNCLKLLKENKLKSVAFPCISTGIFGYPNLNAAKVALSTIRIFLEEDDYGPQVERIIMCLFMKEDVDIYHEQMQMYFPFDHSDASNSNNTSSDKNSSEQDKDSPKKSEDSEEPSKSEAAEKKSP